MSTKRLKALAFVTMTVEVDDSTYFYGDSPGVAAMTYITSAISTVSGVKVIRMGVQIEDAAFVASSKPDAEKGTL